MPAELLFFTTSFLAIGYVIILLLMHTFSSKMLLVKRSEDYTPFVSIVIPTLNEGETIEKRLWNIIEMEYPKSKLEVIFVDASSDITPDIIRKYQKDYPFLRLLRQEKLGFNNALNQGYSAAKAEIVIKSDCDAFPDPDALRRTVPNFADENIGAVCGLCGFLSKDRDPDERESEFRSILHKIQLLESYFHSSLVSHGSFGAYRKFLIPDLREELTADDSEVVVNVVRHGFRAIIDPSVKSVEKYPESFKDRVKQKSRRAAGVMRVIVKNLDMFLNPKYGMFGFITLPIEFFILMLTPTLGLLTLFLFIYYSFVYSPVLLTLPLTFFGFMFLPTRLSKIVRSVIDTLIICFLGLFQVFTKKKEWKTTCI